MIARLSSELTTLRSLRQKDARIAHRIVEVEDALREARLSGVNDRIKRAQEDVDDLAADIASIGQSIGELLNARMSRVQPGRAVVRAEMGERGVEFVQTVVVSITPKTAKVDDRTSATDYRSTNWTSQIAELPETRREAVTLLRAKVLDEVRQLEAEVADLRRDVVRCEAWLEEDRPS